MGIGDIPPPYSNIQDIFSHKKSSGSLGLSLSSLFPREHSSPRLSFLGFSVSWIDDKWLSLPKAELSGKRHHHLNGHEFEQTLGVGDGQGSLACCSPCGPKESDMTEQLNWLTDLRLAESNRERQAPVQRSMESLKRERLINMTTALVSWDHKLSGLKQH